MPSWKKVIVSGSDASLNSLQLTNLSNTITSDIVYIDTVTGNLSYGTAGTVTSASFASTASIASTASFAISAQTASYVLNAVTASYVANAQTASYVLNAISSSFASTASYVNPLNQNVLVTGSLNVTGGITGSGLLITGSTLGTLVTITQTGAGSAFAVQDAASPDSTAFIIDTSGSVGIGAPALPSTFSTKLYTGIPEFSGWSGIKANGNNNHAIIGQGSSGYAGVYGENSETSANNNIGVYGKASPGDGDPFNGVLMIGGKFQAAGDPQYATNYSVQLLDGTEAAGKVLVSQDASGSANWSTQLSGSYGLTGSLRVTAGITASLQGTASYVVLAQTASFVTTAQTASYVLNAVSSSFASTASFVTTAQTASFVTTAQTASFVTLAQTASYVANAQTASYIDTLNQNVTVSGSLTVTNDFTVLGSSSIQYITSSQLNIGDNIISVNTINPSVRFGGLAVIDSGSSPQTSGSLLFDSQNNQWIFVHQSTAAAAITSSVLIMGPQTFNNVGNETTLTANQLAKAVGGDLGEHIGDSNITDTGTIVSINSNTEVTGSLKVTTSITSSGLLITGSTTTDLVRITQTGAGNAFVVEDSTSPDTSSFTISNAGNVGIGIAPDTSYKLYALGGNIAAVYGGSATYGVQGSGTNTGVYGSVDGNLVRGVFGHNLYGIGTSAIGIEGQAINGVGVKGVGGIYGGRFSVDNDNGSPIGVYASVAPGENANGTGVYIGGKFEAPNPADYGAGFTGYSVQLQDGTQAAGKVLVSQDASGSANWSTQLSGSYAITGSLTVTDKIKGTSSHIDTNALIQASLLYLSNNF